MPVTSHLVQWAIVGFAAMPLCRGSRRSGCAIRPPPGDVVQPDVIAMPVIAILVAMRHPARDEASLLDRARAAGEPI